MIQHNKKELDPTTISCQCHMSPLISLPFSPSFTSSTYSTHTLACSFKRSIKGRRQSKKKTHLQKPQRTMDFSSICPLLLLLISFPALSLCGSSPNKQQQSAPNYNMVQSELDTVFKIMEKMSSDKPWRASYPNPCLQQGSSSSWPGIECKLGFDNHLHVTRLDFGTPPNPTCKITSSFPSQIFTLPFLQSAFFYNCFTHSTATITFPISTSLINSSLTQLSLRSNPCLIGTIPPQFSSLKSLQVLTLSQNRLSGPIPVRLLQLTSLVHLDLSYNMLTGSIPFQVGNLRSLVGLDLSYNSLKGTIPTTIGQLHLLQKLDLSSNKLVGVIPSTIDQLTSLAFLALSNNQLRGKFPTGLTQLINLQYFLMDDNPMFINLPEELGMLIKLQELHLANSGYSGMIPASFCNLINLTTLSLENNRLTGEIPPGLSSLSHIYHLNLSRNLLEGVVPFNGTFLKRLQSNLDLSGNHGLCLDPKQANNDLKLGDVSVCGQQLMVSSQSQHLHSHFAFAAVFSIIGLFSVNL